MATKICPYCRSTMDSDAIVCPFCRHPVSKSAVGKQDIGTSIIAFLGVSLMVVIGTVVFIALVTAGH